MDKLDEWLKDCAEQGLSEKEVVSGLIDKGYDLDAIQSIRRRYHLLRLKKPVLLGVLIIALICLVIVAYIFWPVSENSFVNTVLRTAPKGDLAGCYKAAHRTANETAARETCELYIALATHDSAVCSTSNCRTFVATATGDESICDMNICRTQAKDFAAIRLNDAQQCMTQACRTVIAVRTRQPDLCDSPDCAAAAARNASCTSSACIRFVALADGDPSICSRGDEATCVTELALLHRDTSLCDRLSDSTVCKQALNAPKSKLISAESDLAVLNLMYSLASRR